MRIAVMDASYPSGPYHGRVARPNDMRSKDTHSAKPREPGAVDPRIAWLDRMREFRGRRERDITVNRPVDAFEREFKDRHRALGDIIDAWNELSPLSVRGVVTISGLAQGTLTLTMTSSSASFEISRILRDGLEHTLVTRFPSRIRRIKVRVGGEPSTS